MLVGEKSDVPDNLFFSDQSALAHVTHNRLRQIGLHQARNFSRKIFHRKMLARKRKFAASAIESLNDYWSATFLSLDGNLTLQLAADLCIPLARIQIELYVLLPGKKWNAAQLVAESTSAICRKAINALVFSIPRGQSFAAEGKDFITFLGGVCCGALRHNTAYIYRK